MKLANKVFSTASSLVILSVLSACSGKSSGPAASLQGSGEAPATADTTTGADGSGQMTLAASGDITSMSIVHEDGSAITGDGLVSIKSEFADLSACANVFESANRVNFWQSTGASFDLLATDSVALMVRDGAVQNQPSIAFLGADVQTAAGEQSQEQADTLLRFSCTQTITSAPQEQGQEQDQAQSQEMKETAKVESRTETIYINVLVNPDEVKVEQEQSQEAKPEVKQEQDAKPEVKQEQDAKPEVKQEQDAKPEVKQEQDAKPEVKQEQDAKPEVKQEQDAKPEVKQEQDAKPEVKPTQDAKPDQNQQDDSK